MISSTKTPWRLVRRAAPWAFVAAVAAVIPLTIAGCSSSTSASPRVVDTYGGVPSYLPKDTVHSDQVLSGSVEKPALTAEGDGVEVSLPTGGSVLATVTGPDVPGEGFAVQPETTTCTWTISLSGATRDVPVTLADLTTLDQLGNVYRLSPVAGRAAIPAVVHPGQTVSFEVRTVMKTGEGVLRWAPANGKAVASWDFEVEID